jgi:hypothetical protein
LLLHVPAMSLLCGRGSLLVISVFAKTGYGHSAQSSQHSMLPVRNLRKGARQAATDPGCVKTLISPSYLVCQLASHIRRVKMRCAGPISFLRISFGTAMSIDQIAVLGPCKRVKALMAFIIFAMPRRAIKRLKLYARTCRLISVATCSRPLVRKCVAPIQALIVPNGCSTVQRRVRIASGVCSSRACIFSRTS